MVNSQVTYSVTSINSSGPACAARRMGINGTWTSLWTWQNSQNSVENKFSKKDSLAVNKHHYYGNCDRP